MGMAASQARFLGLTARKTNVEFEGQRINQQRTTLSNQSANYYNQLLGMAVPVPPSVDDYTKTVYADYSDKIEKNNTRTICYIAHCIKNSSEFNGLSEDNKKLILDLADKYTQN